MIINLFLGVIKTFLSVLLAPLEIINITVDLIVGIPIVTSFLQLIAYILPWNNILPLIILTIAIFGFRIIVSLIKTIWQLIPFV